MQLQSFSGYSYKIFLIKNECTIIKVFFNMLFSWNTLKYLCFAMILCDIMVLSSTILEITAPDSSFTDYLLPV